MILSPCHFCTPTSSILKSNLGPAFDHGSGVIFMHSNGPNPTAVGLCDHALPLLDRLALLGFAIAWSAVAVDHQGRPWAGEGLGTIQNSSLKLYGMHAKGQNQ